MIEAGSAISQPGIVKSGVDIASITDNTSQHLIYTTEDKLEICIRDYRNALKKEQSITTPFATATTLMITIFTV